MANPELYWLPQSDRWLYDMKAVEALPSDDDALWDATRALAGIRMDFLQTMRLDRQIRRLFPDAQPGALTTQPIRLAILGTATVDHLCAGIRVALLRRGLWAATYVCHYGMMQQELFDTHSDLHRFAPTHVLFSIDAGNLTSALDTVSEPEQARAALAAAVGDIRGMWKTVRETLRAKVIQQTVVPRQLSLMGSNEHRAAASRDWFVCQFNDALRQCADTDGADLVAVDRRIARDGLRAWHTPNLWHRAKQEIAPGAAPMYGELVARVLAAQQGRSHKCLILDLDNTMWGGVIGDDGLQGIKLGQGNAYGEAFLAFQSYVRDLGRRGVILAVCSKNDEANALAPFVEHPEMLLRKGDIACFVANWNDKASNIRSIAKQLNIGLDFCAFVDDNPFERNLIRQELPMVAVPEMSDDPASYAQTVADAGYFEGLSLTDEDLTRNQLYQANWERETLRESSTDLNSYLRGLDMKIIWRRFDPVGAARITQLINKTNQFNLTTKRYTDDEVAAVMADCGAFGLQIRLTDRFGDNGIVSVIIGRLQPNNDVLIDTWLMSCRVLGRQMEEATLNLVAAEAQRLGGHMLIGEYRATKKNGMVKEHYQRLGFTVIEEQEDGSSHSRLDLGGFEPAETFIKVIEGFDA
jgi:FkbH-like protein